MKIRRHLHTTVNHETFEKLDELRKETGKPIGRILDELIGSINTEMGTEGIRQLNYIENLIIKAFRELDVCIISKEQLEVLVEGKVDEAITTNANEFAIEWLYSRPIDKLTLEEVVEGIKTIWLACNRVRKVETVQKDSSIVLIFHSTLKSKKIDELFCRQLKHLFEQYFDVSVEYKLRSQGYIIVINKNKT